MPRPSILDEVIAEIDQGVRQDQLTKSKKQIEEKLLEILANVRLQEDVVKLKEAAYAASEDASDFENEKREEALDSAKLILEDSYQGAEALANELRRVNTALEEMKTAGLAPFGNRAARRKK